MHSASNASGGMDTSKRLYCFRRRTPEGRSSLLVGLEIWAETPEAAMHYLRITMGHTGREGWYCEDVTDNREFRAWLRGGRPD